MIASGTPSRVRYRVLASDFQKIGSFSIRL